MKKAFIFWGGWDGHQPKESMEKVLPWLEAAGIETIVDTSLDRLADPDFMAGIDLVVPVWTMGQISGKQTAGIRSVLERGGGLAGWHGGAGDAFRSDSTYQFMLGGQFVAHPGDIHTYTVSPVPGVSDPIIDGIGPFEVESEKYYLHVDPSNEVLLETFFDGSALPWIDGVRMPVAWKRPWGPGRVFYLSVGHAPHELDIPEVRTVLERGLMWAAGA